MPWETLAAIAAARTGFGARDCKSATGLGFYNVSPKVWAKYAIDAGSSTVTASTTTSSTPASAKGASTSTCYSANAPAKILKKTKDAAADENPFDPVDATFAVARYLADSGGKAGAWDYTGGDPGECNCNTARDGQADRWDGSNNLSLDVGAAGGAAPSAQHVLEGGKITGLPGGGNDCSHVEGSFKEGIPLNYLIIYKKVAEASHLDPTAWALLAAFGACETDFGQSDAPGVKNGVNTYGCCSGPMQFSLWDTWHQPGALGTRLWRGNPSAHGLENDFNGDGQISVWDPRDAIPASLLKIKPDLDNGNNWYNAAFSYNHSAAYARGIVMIADAYKRLALTTHLDFSQLTANTPQTSTPAPTQVKAGKATSYNGASPDDKLSRAIASLGGDGKNSYSDCMVAIIHEWYAAILNNPPGLAIGGSGSLVKLLSIAYTQVGVTEIPAHSNNGPQVAMYDAAVGMTPGGEGAPWCAAFVSWAAQRAGIPLLANGMGSASAPAIMSWAISTGIWKPVSAGKPNPGDLVIYSSYKYPSGGAHIGIVLNGGSPFDNIIMTIEGNSGDSVRVINGQSTLRNPGSSEWVAGYVALSNRYGKITTDPAQFGGDGSPFASKPRSIN